MTPSLWRCWTFRPVSFSRNGRSVSGGVVLSDLLAAHSETMAVGHPRVRNGRIGAPVDVYVRSPVAAGFVPADVTSAGQSIPD